MFFKAIIEKSISIYGYYVIDILQAGKPEEKEKTKQKFKESIDVTFSNKNIFKYTWMNIDSSKSQLRTISISEYINKIKFSIKL